MGTVIYVMFVMDRITKQYLGTVALRRYPLVGALRRVVANCWLRVCSVNCDLCDYCDGQD